MGNQGNPIKLQQKAAGSLSLLAGKNALFQIKEEYRNTRKYGRYLLKF